MMDIRARINMEEDSISRVTRTEIRDLQAQTSTRPVDRDRMDLTAREG